MQAGGCRDDWALGTRPQQSQSSLLLLLDLDAKHPILSDSFTANKLILSNNTLTCMFPLWYLTHSRAYTPNPAPELLNRDFIRAPTAGHLSDINTMNMTRGQAIDPTSTLQLSQ
jgi:hypothetical protein